MGSVRQALTSASLLLGRSGQHSAWVSGQGGAGPAGPGGAAGARVCRGGGWRVEMRPRRGDGCSRQCDVGGLARCIRLHASRHRLSRTWQGGGGVGRVEGKKGRACVRACVCGGGGKASMPAVVPLTCQRQRRLPMPRHRTLCSYPLHHMCGACAVQRVAAAHIIPCKSPTPAHATECTARARTAPPARLHSPSRRTQRVAASSGFATTSHATQRTRPFASNGS